MLIMLFAAATIPAPLQVQTGAYLDTRRPVFDETDVAARIERMRQSQRDAERRAADLARRPVDTVPEAKPQTDRSHADRPANGD